MLSKIDIDFGDDHIVSGRRTLARRPVGAVAAFAGLMIFIFFGGQMIMSGCCEGYCLVWPSVGTRFAPEFSHSGFNRIQAGMTREQVLAEIGKPLDKSAVRWRLPKGMDDRRELGDEAWQYSSDSGALGGDWAWLSREVIFRNGRVHHTFKWVFYD